MKSKHSEVLLLLVCFVLLTLTGFITLVASNKTYELWDKAILLTPYIIILVFHHYIWWKDYMTCFDRDPFYKPSCVFYTIFLVAHPLVVIGGTIDLDQSGIGSLAFISLGAIHLLGWIIPSIMWGDY